MKYRIEDFKKPDCHQKRIIVRRKLDPANYLVIKATRTDLYLWDIRFGKVKHIPKWR